MPGKSNHRQPIDYHHSRYTQISESHCGPAVIQMLLQHLGFAVTQEAIAEAGAASDLIEQQGMRVDQLARAVRQLAPRTRFWYKDHSTIKEIARIVNSYRYPVGIEWQGFFEDTLEDETEDGDYGHYSVVTRTDPGDQKLMIVDPYKDFRSQDRVFTYDFFQTRWWDVNEVTDPLTGTDYLVEDRQMMFVITMEKAGFPLLLGMKSE